MHQYQLAQALYQQQAVDHQAALVTHQHQQHEHSQQQLRYQTTHQVAHKIAAESAAAYNKRACQPDVDAPFAHLDDAIVRLLPYHLFSGPDEEEVDIRGEGTVPAVTVATGTNAAAAAADSCTKHESTIAEETKGEAGRQEQLTEEELASASPLFEELMPVRSRAQAWAETCSDFARKFETEMRCKRARVDGFQRSMERVEGLRPEEAYLVETMMYEEVKKRDSVEKLKLQQVQLAARRALEEDRQRQAAAAAAARAAALARARVESEERQRQSAMAAAERQRQQQHVLVIHQQKQQQQQRLLLQQQQQQIAGAAATATPTSTYVLAGVPLRQVPAPLASVTAPSTAAAEAASLSSRVDQARERIEIVRAQSSVQTAGEGGAHSELEGGVITREGAPPSKGADYHAAPAVAVTAGAAGATAAAVREPPRSTNWHKKFSVSWQIVWLHSHVL